MLKHLEELILDFTYLPEKITAQNFMVLYGFLGDLPQLQNLQLHMNEDDSSDASILFFSKVIPKLRSLHTFQVKLFSSSKLIAVKGSTLVRLIESFTHLKVLSSLLLGIRCSEVDSECAKLLVSSLKKMKRLNNLYIFLEKENGDKNPLKCLDKLREQLQMKIDTHFYFGVSRVKMFY